MRRMIASIGLATIMMSGAAYAGPIYDPTISTCTGVNCSSVVLGGTLLSLGTGSAGQWVQEVFATAGQCVRHNDQGGGACTNCPIVKIGSAPKTGWYTVNIAQTLGNAAEGNFVLAYGRYPNGNANCNPPTPPLLTTKPKSSAARGSDVAPANGPPTR
jgi:hypothetical protein